MRISRLIVSMMSEPWLLNFNWMIDRRSFLKDLSLGAAALTLAWRPNPVRAAVTEPTITTFGLIADVHQDIMHDAEQRLSAFVEEAAILEPDFIIQLGDFCEPKARNEAFLQTWNQFKGPRYHVLGNHDMDSSSKEKTMDFWGMPAKFYSFDHANFHFVVLDANYLYLDGKFVDYDTANFYIDPLYRTWVHPEQLEWLEADLRATTLATVILSHQGLANDAAGIRNRTEIQLLLERINEEAQWNKVIACLNGHHHIDRIRTINGIHYIDINSASYQWLGDKYQCFTRYSKETYEQHPALAKVAPYKDPLYAFVELDPEGSLLIRGKDSEWLGPSPEELGFPKGLYGVQYTPRISTRGLSAG